MAAVVTGPRHEMATFAGDRVAKDVREEMGRVRAAELCGRVAIVARHTDVQRAIEMCRPAMTFIAAIARMIGGRISVAPFAAFPRRLLPARNLGAVTGGHGAAGRIERCLRAFAPVVEVSAFQDISRNTMAFLAADRWETLIAATGSMNPVQARTGPLDR